MRNNYLIIRIFVVCTSFLSLNHVCHGQTENWNNLTGINSVAKIIDDHPFLWLATDGGLIKYNKNTGETIKYTKANAGLPGNKLAAIAKDERQIWLGFRYSSIGLGKFNGTECTIYNPQNSGLKLYSGHTALTIDKSKRLWVGEMKYITSFDGTVFTSYDCPIDPRMSQLAILQLVSFDYTVYASGLWNSTGLKDVQKHKKNKNLNFLFGGSGMVCDNSGKLYFSQGNGLVIYEEGKWNEYNTLNSNIPSNNLGIGDIDQYGNIWFTSDKGLIKYDGDSFVLFDFPDSSNLFITTMCIDEDNTVWLGGLTDRLLQYKDNVWNWIDLTDNSKYSSINKSMAYDSLGNLWISTSKRIQNTKWVNYLIKYDGIDFTNYTKSDLLNNGAELVFEDSLRDILVIDDLLFDYKDSTWYTHDLSNNKISSEFIKDDKGFIWEASAVGLKKYQNSEYTIYSTENSSLPTNQLCKLAVDNENNMFISNYSSYIEKGILFKFNFNKSEIIYTSNDVNYLINAFIIDEKNSIWFGVRDRGLQESGEGLFKMENGQLSIYNISNSELPSNAVDVIHLDDSGTIWASANNGGIVKIENGNWTIFELFNSALPSLNNYSIASFKNNIAVLSVDEGITIFPENTFPVKLINTDLHQSDKVLLFPNPVQNGFQIRFSDSTILPIQLKCFDISGKLINQMKIIHNSSKQQYFFLLSELNISKNGIYIIKVQTNKGVYAKKILVNI